MGRFALSFLIVLAASCSFAQKVHVQFDRRVDYSKFKTYAWLESKQPAEGVWAQQLVAAIDRQLTRKGLERVASDASPDLEVVYNTGVKERTIVQGYDYGYVYAEYVYKQLYGLLWLWPTPGSWVSEVEKNGSLVVDLVDVSTKDLVWRGVASSAVSEQTKVNEHRLNKAVQKMFKKYPPKKHGGCRWRGI